MKRGGSFSFLLLTGFSVAVLAFWKNPDAGRLSPYAEVLAGPAPEAEWAPPPQEPGAIEQTMKKVIQPAIPSKSIQSKQPNAPANPDLSLPAESPSLNLNPSVDRGDTPPVQAPLLPPVDPGIVLPPIVDAPPALLGPPTVPPLELKKDAPAVQDLLLRPNDPGIVPPQNVEVLPAPKVPPIAPRLEKDAPPIMIEPVLPPVLSIQNPNVKPMPQPGDATMKSMKSVMAAVVGAALLAASANGEEPKDLSKSLEKLDAAVKKLETVEKSLNDYKFNNEATLTKVQDAVNAMKSEIGQLKADVSALRQSASNPPITSKRVPTTETAPKMATVRLVNDYTEEMSFVVNGAASYRLPPGQSRTIAVPAGTFTYQILQLQPSVQERPIAANEEKSIRVYTR